MTNWIKKEKKDLNCFSGGMDGDGSDEEQQI